jgi:hypothetical protein
MICYNMYWSNSTPTRCNEYISTGFQLFGYARAVTAILAGVPTARTGEV